MLVDTYDGELVLANNRWTDNHACLVGGALAASTTNWATIDGDVFEDNTAASGLGGAASLTGNGGTDVDILNARFVGNSALHGGAVYVQDVAVSFSAGEVLDNVAEVVGGGLSCVACRELQITKYACAWIVCKAPSCTISQSFARVCISWLT
jgi:predicted outer membrane repeat protein